MPATPVIRLLQATDSIEALTTLLHRAYASLAAQGWNFTASDQPADITRQRVAHGPCFVAADATSGALLGTVSVRGPYQLETDPWCHDSPWYTRADTAIVSQLCVAPEHQRQGLAEQLMDAAEAWARQAGYAQIALDTAALALDLQRRYARRGYRQVAVIRREGKTYDSVLMVKPLVQAPKPPREPASP